MARHGVYRLGAGSECLGHQTSRTNLARAVGGQRLAAFRTMGGGVGFHLSLLFRVCRETLQKIIRKARKRAPSFLHRREHRPPRSGRSHRAAAGGSVSGGGARRLVRPPRTCRTSKRCRHRRAGRCACLEMESSGKNPAPSPRWPCHRAPCLTWLAPNPYRRACPDCVGLRFQSIARFPRSANRLKAWVGIHPVFSVREIELNLPLRL